MDQNNAFPARMKGAFRSMRQFNSRKNDADPRGGTLQCIGMRFKCRPQ
jgi:hypothetical protein